MTAKPLPPAACPASIPDQFEDYDPEQLRAIAEYATALAAFKTDQDDTNTDATDEQDALDPTRERPGDVPARATRTKKTIKGNDYWYWQWRDGEQVKSEYIGPVDPDK